MNNFTVLRLFTSLLVIFSHSFGFLGKRDPVFEFTGSLTGGLLAVNIFFVISGYLVSESWFRNPRLIPYFIKRILRIYPALIVVIILSVFLLGPLLSTFSIAEYFTNPKTYSYFINLSLWKLQFNLPGIFINGMAATFNAPLWTLFFEFTMYILLPIFGLMGILNSGKIWILWLLVVVFAVIDMYGIPKNYFLIKINVFYFSRFFLYFFGGVLYRHYIKDKKAPAYLFLIFFAGVILSRGSVFLNLFILLTVISFVFWFSFLKWHPLKRLVANRDYSYGLYLYGFIMQNFVHYYLEFNSNFYWKMLLSVALAWVFAFFSWHLVESKALKFKNKFSYKKYSI